MLNHLIYLSGDSIFLSDIGPQPANSSDPGSTFVCVTTNVNSACCGHGDTNGTTNDTVGEWYYPDHTLVPHPDDNLMEFARFSYTQQVRLAREVSGSSPPLGVYTCEVPETLTNVLHNASIIIYNKGNLE